MSNYIPGLDILGKGYDVFGRFAHPSGVYNANIFQDFVTLAEADNSATTQASVDGTTYDVPYPVSIVEEHTAEGTYVQGSSVSNFQSELDVKVKMKGKYKFYSGEARFGFHQAKQTSQQLYYTRFSSLSKAYRLALPANSKIRPLLDPDFLAALESDDNTTAAIDDFFDRYGTHFLAEIVLGGSNNYYATVEKSSVSTEMEVQASVKASYNSLFASGSVSVDSSYSSTEYEASTHSETGIETVGGDSTLAPLMLTDEDAYGLWLDSIMVDPALVDFTDQSLRPIWELCDTTESNVRQQALQDRFDELAGVSNSTNTQGVLQHGAAIYPPWGTKDDWNLFLTPSVIGRSEEDQAADVDNAILEFDYGIDDSFDYPDHWQIKAKYRYRTANEKVDGNYHIKWYFDGWANYILLPKNTYIHKELTDLNYDKFYPEEYIDPNTEIVYEANGFYLKEQLKYRYLPDLLEVQDADDPANVFYTEVYQQNEAFYTKRKVSEIEEVDYNEELTSPDGTDDWYTLLGPAKLERSEGEDSKDIDNGLLYWNWNNAIGDYRYSSGVPVAVEGTSYALPTYRYRESAKEEGVTSIGAKDSSLLWVHKDFSYWTGAYGKQDLQLPEGDSKTDDWELIVAPIRMGNPEETSDKEWKDSALLQTKCSVVQFDSYWTVESSYLWSGNENDVTTVSWEDGQAECLFIRTSVLADTSLG